MKRSRWPLIDGLRQVRQEIRKIYEISTSLSRLRVDIREAIALARAGEAIQLADSDPEAQPWSVVESAATWVPPGHFYSPIVNVDELRARRSIIFDRKAPLPGIDLRSAEQLAMVERLAKHYDSLPFPAQPTTGLRYFYENSAFSYGDAIVLGCMLAELRPRRLLEFGSGYSSCATLDVDEHVLGGQLNCTFVDPYPELLHSLHGRLDPTRHRIVCSQAQDVDLTLVDCLASGDVLFIDSTHVSKAGSDVNFHLFTVLPRLRSGVFIHFHDVFYPFEYPEEWFFEENRSWNELYLLRAFLMDNPGYEIVMFNNYLGREHIETMVGSMPLFMRNAGGSLWLRKI